MGHFVMFWKWVLNELKLSFIKSSKHSCNFYTPKIHFRWMSVCLMRLWRGSGFIFGLQTEGQWELTDVVGRNCTHYYGLRIRTTWSRSARINTLLRPMRTFFFTLHTVPLLHNYRKGKNIWHSVRNDFCYLTFQRKRYIHDLQSKLSNVPDTMDKIDD